MPRKSVKRMRFLRTQVTKQRQWIERCENNGVSYADGQRGVDIKAADLAHLGNLQSELATYGENP